MKIYIDRMDHLGNGIGKINDKIVFVPKTLSNENIDINIIEEKKKYCIGKINEIITPSAKRINSMCPYFDKCTGCHLRHISYDDTINFKKEKLENIFLRYLNIKRDIEVIPGVDNYRNKVKLQIENRKIGYYIENSHTLCEITSCLNVSKSINSFISNIYKLDIANGEITIRSNDNDELLIIINTNDKVNLNIKNDFKITGIVINNKCVFGNSYFINKINDLYFKVSYNSFFQVNNYMNGILFNILDDYIKENEIVLDLYCGVGTLGLSVSRKLNKVIGIDISKSNIMDAIKNAEINKINNAYYLENDASTAISKIKDNIDTLIVDPPRAGLTSMGIKHIFSANPKKIIYISCNPMTLVRDLKELLNKYEIENVIGLDMFPYTYHVETICVLNKNLKE